MEQSFDLNLLSIFARTAELGSFSASAKSLKLPKSTISRSIKRLESELKAPLFLRTTRHVELTPFGQSLFRVSYAELTALNDRIRSTISESTAPSRLIRITAVEDMGGTLLPEVLSSFSKRYPKVRYELLLSNEQLNLIREGVDIAVRVGKISQTSYKKRRLGDVAFALFASPRYRDRFPEISVEDLSNHPMLMLPSFASKRKVIQLERASSLVHVPISARSTASSSMALLRMVQLDLGIGILPKFLVHDALQQGSIVQICQGWTTPPKEVSMLFTATQTREPIIKELGDCIYEQFRRRLSF